MNGWEPIYPLKIRIKLRKLNEELSLLSLTFGENLLAETNKNFKLVITDSADLAGLPQGVIDGAAETAHADSVKGMGLYPFKTQHDPIPSVC